jgi:uncharacterized protein YciI
VPYYAVIRERGSAWNASRAMREQERWAEHAAFMDELADSGFIVMGGPLGDGDNTLLIVDAQSDEAIHERLAADPWTPMNMLSVARIDPWHVLLDSTRHER